MKTQNTKMRTVHIEPTDLNTYTVNNKEVYQDIDGNWVAKGEFNSAELRAWSNYKTWVIDSKSKQAKVTFHY